MIPAEGNFFFFKFMRPLRMSEKLVLGVPKDVNPSNLIRIL